VIARRCNISSSATPLACPGTRAECLTARRWTDLPTGGGSAGSECRRAQDAKRDIPDPLSPCARRQPLGPGRPDDAWLDAVSDALCIPPSLPRDRWPLRPSGGTLAPTPFGVYRPSLRSPWPAARENRFRGSVSGFQMETLTQCNQSHRRRVS
jgi:hypothetical protein